MLVSSRSEKIEKCSESTGINLVLFFLSSFLISGHPQTIASLFAIAINFVLLIIFIVFASKNKKLKKLAKKQSLDQKVLYKHYPALFWFIVFLPTPLYFASDFIVDAYGKGGVYVFFGLLLFLIPVIGKVGDLLLKKAKLKEQK